MIGDVQFAALMKLKPSGARLQKQLADPRGQFGRAMKWCVDLGLVGQPKRWILEIGGGVPYLAAAASLFGHDVLSLDEPDPVLDEAARVLGYDYCEHLITRGDLLPTLPHGFDLIAALSGLTMDGDLCPMKDAARVIDAALRRLNPGGRIVAAFPREYQHGRWTVCSRWRRLLRSHVRITACPDWIEFVPK